MEEFLLPFLPTQELSLSSVALRTALCWAALDPVLGVPAVLLSTLPELGGLLRLASSCYKLTVFTW